MSWDSSESWEQHLDQCPVPRGFRFFRTGIRFSPEERPGASPYAMNISFLLSDSPGTTAAAVATQNRYPGAPVQLLRERRLPGPLRGILINNKVANVAAPGGLETARRLAAAAALQFGIPEHQTLSVSTGVIGWALPWEPMVSALTTLDTHECSPRQFAEAIMTTDRYPKVAWSTAPGGPIMMGAAKGAGMIEPDMATMLGFFTTDAVVAPEVLQETLKRVVERSFNALSVDGDQSTSDMVIALASGATGVSVGSRELEKMWQPVADELALEIVRNGEGTAHVLEVTVRGVADRSLARKVGRHVVNSPLVKTAVYGNDPNIGRILGALGSALHRYDPRGTVDPRELTITIADCPVYRDGAFQIDKSTEQRLSALLAARSMDPELRGYPQDNGTVAMVLDFGGAAGEDVRVLGSDLSYEYIRENADYRT